jgi:ABC-type oligopeptide transport system ATPase subunit
MSIRDALEEVLAVWRRRNVSKELFEPEELLEMVHLPKHFMEKRPHELSGGERQRVAIARAMAVGPDFVVADEPVSSLDVSAAARILNLLLELRETASLTSLFITHDLGLARIFADRIAVMRLGEIVESGKPEVLFGAPQHEYTKALIGAQLDPPGQAFGEDPTAINKENGKELAESDG